MTKEDIKTIIDIVHETIYGFFDVCDEEETPMTDKDKLLLKINKAICTNIKALEQEPKTEQEDDYFRKIVEVAISQLRADRDRLEDELAKREQEPCDNAVSRQAALDAMYELCNTGETLEENPWRDNPHIDAITDAINNLPPVNPQEPKTGHWVRFDNGKYHWYLCSCCDAMACSDEKMMAYKYCPNCGCRMFEPQERSDVE